MNESNSSRSPRVESLRGIELLSCLDGADLQLLISLARQELVPRGRFVYRSDGAATALYFLLDGKVRIAKLSREGKELTLAILVPGDLFGEQAILGPGQRGTLAEVIEDAAVCTIGSQDFERFVRQRPGLAYRVVQLLARRQREIEARIEELAFRDVPTRLARLLIRLAEEHGDAVPEGIRIDLPLTHQEVANLIGATRETTTATLNGFRRAGVVTLGRKRIVITDPDRLGTMAKAAHQLVVGDNGKGGSAGLN